MKVAYVAPNRSHHFGYAEALEKASLLGAFVSGYPRVGGAFKSLAVEPRRVVHADAGQMLYLLSHRLRLPWAWRERCNLLSKLWMDRAFARAMQTCDVGLFYSGCGWRTLKRWRGKRQFVVEAVNTHLDIQHEILEEEAERLNLPPPQRWMPEVHRRRAEYALADYILGPSNFVLDSFRKEGWKEAQLLKNLYGCRALPPASSVPEENAGEPSFTILYVGQLNFRKGLRYLVEAFDQLPVQAKRLHLVGPTSEPSGLPENIPPEVEMPGVLRGAALSRAYQMADVFVQPSIEEGLSLVIGEAMQCGLPIVATTSSGAPELLDQGQEGFLTSPRDVRQLAEHLTWLAQNPDARRQMGQAAQTRARQHASAPEAGRQLAACLQRACASKKTHSG